MQGVINIFGDIGVDVTLIDVVSQVKKQPEATSFVVNIDSAGGLVSEGFDIYDYLVSIKRPIHTKGRGVVASIATVIFMAGETRSTYKDTKFMIHLPYVGLIENAGSEDLDELSRLVKVDEKRLIDFYSKGTSIETSAITAMLRNETYLSEEQLFDLGFTTEKQAVQIAAKLIIKNDMNNKQKEEGKSLLEQIKNLFKETKTVNKILFSADEKEVEFPDVDEDGQIAVGDTVMFDGSAAPDGDITLKDGRVITVLNGKVDKIMEAEEEVVEEVVDLVITSVEGQSINFPEVENIEDVKEGDIIIVDEVENYEGILTLQDGRVLIIIDGKVDSISTAEALAKELKELMSINAKMKTTLKEVQKFQSKLLEETPEPRKVKEDGKTKSSWSEAINKLNTKNK